MERTSEDHDLGLAHDLPLLINRRRALGLLAGGVGLAVAACGSSETGGSGQAATSTAASAASEIAEETAGPFPGDGSNGPNALTDSGVVRSDIRGSFGGSSGTADGVKTTVDLTLLDVSAGGKPLAGAAVYLWHCDMAGRYSMYDEEVASENFLRGVQESDADGELSFTSIFPGGVCRALAAHPLRDLREHRRGYVGELEAQDLSDRAAEGGLRPGLRDQGIRAERAEPRSDLARHRQRLPRRLRGPARVLVRISGPRHCPQAQRRCLTRSAAGRRTSQAHGRPG